jgi:hypothetical protein
MQMGRSAQIFTIGLLAALLYVQIVLMVATLYPHGLLWYWNHKKLKKEG